MRLASKFLLTEVEKFICRAAPVRGAPVEPTETVIVVFAIGVASAADLDPPKARSSARPKHPAIDGKAASKPNGLR
jgi:hypothetical protein